MSDEATPYTPTPAEKLLIEALRSGRYVQTKHCLRNHDGYCCLGVAMDLFGEGEWVWDRFLEQFAREGSTGVLSERVMKVLGWNSDNGSINADLCLSSLNDDGKTFEEIADIIERGEVVRG